MNPNDWLLLLPKLQPVDWYGIVAFVAICSVLLYLDTRVCKKLQELKEQVDNGSV